MRVASSKLAELGQYFRFFTSPPIEYTRPVYTPPAYTPPVPRTPAYTPPVPRTPAYTPPIAPRRIEPTPVQRQPVARRNVQTSYQTLATHMLELSLRANSSMLARVNVRNPLTRPARSTPLLATVYDNIKKYAARMLSRASIPFTYQTVTGQTFVVESSGIRNSAVKYMDKALKAWGYIRSLVPRPVTPEVRRMLPVERDFIYTPPAYTPPVPRTPAYTPPVPRTPAYTPPIAPRRIEPTPVQRQPVARRNVQTSYQTLATHMLELSLRANSSMLARVNVRNPLTRPARSTPLLATVYDNIKKYAARMLSRASIPFTYQTVTGQTFVVESSGIRNSAVKYMDKALKAWGYIKTEVSAGPVLRRMLPVERDYVYTPPVRTPAYTPTSPDLRRMLPVERDYVYTPPVETPAYRRPSPELRMLPVDSAEKRREEKRREEEERIRQEMLKERKLRITPVERDFVWTPPAEEALPEVVHRPITHEIPEYQPGGVEARYTPTAEITPTGYPVQASYKTLARHILELSLEANAAILAQVNIANPLSRFIPPVELLATVYDAIKNYAIRTLSGASIPFGYETVRGEKFKVESTPIRNSAIAYMDRTLKQWGYIRGAAAPTPAYITPVTPIPSFPTRPIMIHHLTPPLTPEPTPPYISPVELPVVTEEIMVEEGKALVWAVSYTLAEAGYPQYAYSSEKRTGVSQEVFNSLVSRARYIAQEMIQQNTYSPRL